MHDGRLVILFVVGLDVIGGVSDFVVLLLLEVVVIVVVVCLFVFCFLPSTIEELSCPNKNEVSGLKNILSSFFISFSLLSTEWEERRE